MKVAWRRQPNGFPILDTSIAMMHTAGQITAIILTRLTTTAIIMTTIRMLTN
ncbi:MAG: hypothetical protein ACYTEK_17950 [Planctomycetota bacterium]